MTLAIGDRTIVSFDQLSEHARLAISLVDGGAHWLHWAIHEPATQYVFPDESVLAGAVQQGLHGERLALLRNLQVLVSPIKLMTLGIADLRVLVRAEEGETGPKFEAHCASILEAHGIRTQKQLQQARSFLGEIVDPADPLFQVLTLSDQLALQDLLWTPQDGDPANLAVQKEAAAFALHEARTPPEFVDYYQVYLALAAKYGAKADTPAKRLAHAERALHALLPALLHAIDCPEVLGLVSPGEVAEAVQVWAGYGRPLGFQRISAGVREIVRHTKYRNETGEEAREYVAYYMIAVRALLAASPPRWGIMAQDGATCRFPVHAGDHEGEVLLSPSGVISLAWFRRKPKPKHEANPRTAAAA